MASPGQATRAAAGRSLMLQLRQQGIVSITKVVPLKKK